MFGTLFSCFIWSWSFLLKKYKSYRLTLNAPIATNVVCFSRLLKCLRSLYGKQCGPRSDCSYRSSLFWVHTVCFYTLFVSIVRQSFAADDFSRRHFQMHFFLGALRVKSVNDCVQKLKIYSLITASLRCVLEQEH